MKGRNIRTYGRHKNMVIVAEDEHVFSAHDDSNKSVFHSSASNDSSAVNSTGNSDLSIFSSKPKTRNASKSKSNKENEHPEAQTRKQDSSKNKTKNRENLVLSSSTDSSLNSDVKPLKPRNLRGKKKIDYNDSANLKKQLRGTTAKRKRPVKNCDKSSPNLESAVDNFSDFDNYDLFVSSSPSVDLLKGRDKHSTVDTSTPLGKKTRHHIEGGENVAMGDLSHIESVVSPESDVSSDHDTCSPQSSHSSNHLDTPSILSYYSGSIQTGCCTRSQRSRFNNSESLFSDHYNSNTNWNGDKIVPPKTLNMSVEESDSTETESVEYDEEDAPEEDSESDEMCKQSEDEASQSNLSAIPEDDYEEEYHVKKEQLTDNEGDEGNDNDCTDNISMSDKYTRSHYGPRCSKDLVRRVTVNIEKLSESMLKNHVNVRRTAKRSMDKEMNNLTDCFEKSHISNEGDYSGIGVDSVDIKYEDVSKSDYISAVTSSEDYQTAEEEVDDGRGDGDDYQEDDNNTDEVDAKNDEVDDDDDKIIGDDGHVDTKIETRKILKQEKFSTPVKNRVKKTSLAHVLTPSRKSLMPKSAYERVLLFCEQKQPITFTAALSKSMIAKCKKIGEGVYGEVFRSHNSKGEAVAIKVIPIEGDFEVNDEPQKKYDEILPEIVIANELSNLSISKNNMTSGFCKVNNTSCVKGAYPANLIREWDLFHERKRSENDRPDVFGRNQLYIVFEFADCGTDLESYKFDSIQQAKSVLAQVAYALAVGEESLQFEHRDLHWGNVLVRPTDKESIHFRLMGKPFYIPTAGVEASVIDFTLSRLTEDGTTVYINIPDDDALFDGEGDYQFDIYRKMKENNKGNWERFCPYTNVLWLHYLADKLIYATRYPDESERQQRNFIREFRQFLSVMLEYRSARDMVVNSLFLNT